MVLRKAGHEHGTEVDLNFMGIVTASGLTTALLLANGKASRWTMYARGGEVGARDWSKTSDSQ
jgi:hypothetical protein